MSFEAGHLRYAPFCPHCRKILDDGAPLPPIRPKSGFLDWLIPGRRALIEARYLTACQDFRILHESWRQDCLGQATPIRNSWLDHTRQLVRDRHARLLKRYPADVEKYLYKVTHGLAKTDGDYSWEISSCRRGVTDKLLAGILGGSYPRYSEGTLSRCSATLPNAYSWDYLAAELERRADERRLIPRPDFEWTLEYLRTLDGHAFEGWLCSLLQRAGISTYRTQASRDQGADLIVETGGRRIAIQAKHYLQPVGNDAVQQVHTALAYYGAIEGWVVTTSTFTAPAMELARRAGVRLVEGSQLMQLPNLLVGSTPLSRELRPATDLVTPADSLRAVPLARSLDSPASPPASTAIVPSLVATPALNIDWRSEVWETLIVRRRNIWIAVGAFILICLITARITAGHQRDEVREQVLATLQQWTSTMLAEDIAGQAVCYASTVAPYLRSHAATREQIYLEKERVVRLYPHGLRYQLTNINFESTEANRAVVAFDKEWEFSGRGSFSGKERERLELRPASVGRWLITGEQEVQIYWARRNAKAEHATIR